MSNRMNMHINDDNIDNDTSNTLTVPAADVLRPSLERWRKPTQNQRRNQRWQRMSLR